MDIISDCEKLIGKSVNDIPETFFKYLVGYKFKNCGKRYPSTNLSLGEIDYFAPERFEKLFRERKIIILWYNGELIITDLEIYDIFDDLEDLLDACPLCLHTVCYGGRPKAAGADRHLAGAL